MIQRRKRNSSKVNLIISVVFHSTLILAVFFFAAREGMLGKKLKEITVTMVPKEKKPELPKEKPAEQKVEPPKLAELPKSIAIAPPKLESARSPVDTAPSIAPAAVSVPAFEFNDGAHDVQTGDASTVYKGLVELALRSHWTRPEDIDDGQFTAEVELTVDADGQVERSRWLRGSGDPRWDNSVKAAVAQTKSISHQPPKGFPSSFIVRFDVEAMSGGDELQLSSR
jgi:TonB family protein